jgi:hypothetical protein
MVWKPDYITPAQLKNFMRITGTADDAEVTSAIAAASRAIDRECKRQFGQVAAPVARTYTPFADTERGRWVLDIDDLMDDTGLSVDLGDAGVLIDYRLEPVNAEPDGKPWTRLVVGVDSEVLPCGTEHEATITGLWGWAAVPAAVVQACKMQAARWVSRSDSPYGVAGSPEQGSELRLLAKLDPDVAVMLTDVRRLGGPR